MMVMRQMSQLHTDKGEREGGRRTFATSRREEEPELRKGLAHLLLLPRAPCVPRAGAMGIVRRLREAANRYRPEVGVSSELAPRERERGTGWGW
jgi:hypothetical protein